MDIYEKASAKIQEIITEMKAIGLWQDEPLPPDAYNITAAFGADKMSFEQWLQFILVSRVYDIINERGEFPRGSAVGVYAVRAFDGFDEASHLITLLSEFDALFY